MLKKPKSINIWLLPNWRSAAIWGVVLWALIFLESLLVTSIPPLKADPITQKIIHIIMLPFFVAFCAIMYFKGKGSNMKKGFVLGVCFLIITIILDLIISAQILTNSCPAFYTNWSLWVGFAEVLIFSTVTGGLRRGRD